MRQGDGDAEERGGNMDAVIAGSEYRQIVTRTIHLLDTPDY